MSGRRRRAQRRRDLSQHFLRSRTLAASLIRESSISRRDLVIEIGPGNGILTRELAERSGRLVAVELDERLFDGLQTEFGESSHVQLALGDFLDFPLPATPYKVFANVPYSRTAAIIRRLTEASVPPQDAYCIVQREAAERFAASPYAHETLVSLSLKPWWHIEITHRLRRTDFDPPPSVESVMLWMARRTRPLIDAPQGRLYRRFVSDCFGRGGGTARQCLRGVFTGRQISRLARDLRFDVRARPSDLTFDQWLGLFRYWWLNDGATSAIRSARRRR